jgi:Ca2+-binding RTX toxin-like protein
MTTFTGTPAADNFVGADNVADLFQFAPTDLSGADTVIGGAGPVVDELHFTAAGTITAAALVNVSGIEKISLTTGANVLTIPDALVASADSTLTVLGSDGSDSIDGSLVTAPHRLQIRTGSGVSSIQGGAGDDWYVINNGADIIVETAGHGAFDRVFASVDYTLGAGAAVEIISTDNHAGVAVINLAGNELANAIYGNAGNNILTGGGGDDSLNGFGGIDTLNGVQGDDHLYASAGFSTLNGDEGNDVLYGVAGSPAVMNGGTGDDQYFIANAGDIINEAAGEGTNDRVYAHVSYKLTPGAEIEIMSTDDHAGTAAIDLTGNAGDNILYGNAGDNTLDGAAGADTMVGLGGSDTYYIDNAADRVVDAGSPGDFNRAFTTVDWSLTPGQAVALVEMFGSATTLIGNELSQTLVGNSLGNILDGGAGVDTLIGGQGNDSYFVTAGDIIREFASDRTVDRAFARESYVLNSDANIASVEILSTADHAGTAPINLSGNAADQSIYGNEGNNVLDGRGGNDFLAGWGGNDTLVGGAGDDVIDGGLGIDTVVSDGTIDLLAGRAIGTGTDTLIGIENATGGAGNDLLIGDDNNNVLDGGFGVDELRGGGGNDTLIGGAWFVFGTDVLTGGPGSDTFAYQVVDFDRNRDIITDFVSGIDKFQFDAVSYGFAPGQIPVEGQDFISGGGPVATQATATFLMNTSTHELLWDQDGTGPVSAFVVASLSNGATALSSDLLLV